VSERWRSELVPGARIVLAETGGALAGFGHRRPGKRSISIRSWWRPSSGAQAWHSRCRGGNAIARRPELLVNKDNFRRHPLLRKHGFAYAGEDQEPVSGIAVNRMEWRKP